MTVAKDMYIIVKLAKKDWHTSANLVVNQFFAAIDKQIS